MKTIDFIYGGTLATFMLLAIVVFVVIIRAKKKPYDQDQTDGQPVDGYDLPEEDMVIQYGEQPFIDCYQSYN